MKTQQFIEKCVDGMVSKKTYNSSVMYDPDAEAVFSYGYHYPLLFPVYADGKKYMVLNDAGYSHTTSKHIA